LFGLAGLVPVVTSAAAETTAIVVPGFGFVDFDLTAADIRSVEFGYGLFAIAPIGQFDKTESLGPTAVTIRDYSGAFNLAIDGK
jgi:hypothetical protein